MGIIIKNQEQIEGIRKSSRLAAQALLFIESYVKEEVTTGYLNQLLETFIRDHGAVPAPLGYQGYPKATCISLNEVVCHGIPSDKEVIKPGDILIIDIPTILNDVAWHCLELGIDQVFPGNYFGNIGFAINRYAQAKGYSVVHEFCGHGIGIDFHEEPQVEHIGRRNTGPVMQPGMIFTIEPMINQGKSKTKIDRNDGWTARTIDGKLSAQYEHTILVTETGCEVLTDLGEES
jgi:methionyl aminopeptidase